MARRYLRLVRATIAEVVVENLLIRFDIRREATSTPPAGTVDIYNLSDANETRIRERGSHVLLEAGYGEKADRIFEGRVHRVERQRENLDRITRVHVGGSVAAEPTRSIFVQSYIGAVSVRDLIRDGVAELGLELGPIDLIPEDAIEGGEGDGFSYSGPTRIMLTERLRPLGLEWFEDNGGIVRISRIERTADDRPDGVLISEETGMIGTPTVTDEGLRVRSVLDARLNLDTRVRVKSVVAEVSDRAWKVVEVEHAGDNREGPYVTVVELRPLET